ncbi:MAG: SulP family inorganic anion transporter [Roseiflexaceae bacterium]
MGRFGQFGQLIKKEFMGYSEQDVRHDLLSGLTVAAVSLPLALAYGIASGMTPASGLVTAILAGIITGLIGGTSYQMSGPTGAMSAVLLVILHRTGLAGVWTATLIGGALLILMGLLRFGRYVVFIPTPVITGFTAGIAVIIAVGQIDPALGILTPPADTSLLKISEYLVNKPNPNFYALIITGATISIIWVIQRWIPKIPNALIAMLIMTGISWGLGWPVNTIGELPATILLAEHLTINGIPWAQMSDIISAGVSIAALAAIESLMTGTAGAAMSGRLFDADQELIAQGSANMIVPWFGGVPSSAAISRTAVAIRSGGRTRITSIVHSLVLLVCVFFLSQLIAYVPLASLAGVLLWTAWHMIDWATIGRYTHMRIKHALIGVVVTTMATAALDLTEAILIGLAVSAIIHLRLEAEAATVSVVPVDPSRIPSAQFTDACPGVRVAYISGALFFGNAAAMRTALHQERDCHTLILSMRGVPMIDVMGGEVLRQLIHEFQSRNGQVLLAGLQPAVRSMLERLHIVSLVGDSNIFWDAAVAIQHVHDRIAVTGCQGCIACPVMSAGDTKTHPPAE